MTVKRTRRRIFPLALATTLATMTAPAQAQTFTPVAPALHNPSFPLDQVRPGLRGVAYTVFEGVRPEAMDVEILGRLRNALGPGRDMILAPPAGPQARVHRRRRRHERQSRLHRRQTPRRARLPHRPVQQGADCRHHPHRPDAGGSKRSRHPERCRRLGRTRLRDFHHPARSPAHGRDPSSSAASARKLSRASAAPSAPWVLSRVTGLGSMDETRRQPAPLEPGSAVSAVLVDGDLSITGTCTVSYMDANRLMACGHPITQAGAVDLPMAKAEVLATLSSPLNSFKIVNATEIVGAFTEDRSSAIFGRVGAQAHMIPVTLDLSSEGSGRAQDHALRRRQPPRAHPRSSCSSPSSNACSRLRPQAPSQAIAYAARSACPIACPTEPPARPCRPFASTAGWRQAT